MSTSVQDDGKKWIQTSVAITCLILVYVLISFTATLSEWFDLESKVPFYTAGSQILSVLISLGVFVYIMKNKVTSTFLAEVYQEAIKVVWPNKNETVRHTIGIMIGVGIVGFILGVFDFIAVWLLKLIH